MQIIMNKIHLLLLSCIISFCSCKRGVEVDMDQQEPSIELEEPTQLMNLLKNGNCEEWYCGGTGDYLMSWSMADNHKTVFQEYEVVCEGKYSAKLCSYKAGITSSISQTVAVTPGHYIRIYCRYLMEQSSGNGARMYCYFREGRSTNIPNRVLYTFYDEKTLNILRGGGYGIDRFSDTSGEWMTFDYLIKVPAIANYFVFEIHSYVGTTFYVDDCYVIDTNM